MGENMDIARRRSNTPPPPPPAVPPPSNVINMRPATTDANSSNMPVTKPINRQANPMRPSENGEHTSHTKVQDEAVIC